MSTMKNTLVVSLALNLMLTSSVVSFADTTSKHDKLVVLMDILGIKEHLDQQIMLSREQSKQVTDQMFGLLKAKLSSMNQQEIERLQAAGEIFMKACEPAWTVDEAVSHWVQMYGEHVSEQELDQILLFYRSAAGQKDIEATKAVLPKWTGYFSKIDQKRLEEHMDIFMGEMDEIFAAAKSRRAKEESVSMKK